MIKYASLAHISTILASRQFQESEAVLSSGGNCLKKKAGGIFPPRRMAKLRNLVILAKLL